MCFVSENQQTTIYGSSQLDKSKMADRSLINILILSLAFFFIFTAYNTSSGIQIVIVDSINKQNNVEWNAYISLCIVYAVYSVSNFLVPSILTLISTKYCLFLSTLGYLLYDLAFFYPLKYELVIASSICGLTAASLWIAQGQFISDNSTASTIDRNTGIFWAIYQSSMIFGNLYIYFQFEGVETIEKRYRIQTYTVLSVISFLGCITCLFLKKSKPTLICSVDSNDIKSNEIIRTSPLTALKRCLKLLFEKEMPFICLASFYTGVEQSFYGGVFATVVGYSNSFGSDSKKFIGLYGVFNGFGSIIGALIFGWLAKRLIKSNRSGIYFFGFISHLIAFVLVILNHANESPFKSTTQIGYIQPRVWISLLVGVLLCFGDACFNTQIISLISTSYIDFKDQSKTCSAFALYKFFHCIGAAITFAYASFELTLDIHIIILTVFGTAGTLSFYLAEKFLRNKRQ